MLSNVIKSVMILVVFSNLPRAQSATILSTRFYNGEYQIEFRINSTKIDEVYNLSLGLFDKNNKIFMAWNVDGLHDVSANNKNIITWQFSKDRDTKPEIERAEIRITEVKKMSELESVPKILLAKFINGEYQIQYIIKNGKPDETYDLGVKLYDKKNQRISTLSVHGNKAVLGNVKNTVAWHFSKDTDKKPEVNKTELYIEKVNKILYPLEIIGHPLTQITLNKEYKGRLSDQIYMLASGKYFLKAELEGYETYFKEIEVRNKKLTIKLNLREIASTTPPNQKSTDNYDGTSRNKIVKDSKKFNDLEIANVKEKNEIEIPKKNRIGTGTLVDDSEENMNGVLSFCGFGSKFINKSASPISLYFSIHQESINSNLITTALGYPIYQSLKVNYFIGGGISYTFLPFNFEVDLQYSSIKGREVEGNEIFASDPELTLLKTYILTTKVGYCPFILFRRIYPYVGIMAHLVQTSPQSGALRNNVKNNLSTKDLIYSELAYSASIEIYLSQYFSTVLGWEKFQNNDAFDNGYYIHFLIHPESKK